MILEGGKKAVKLEFIIFNYIYIFQKFYCEFNIIEIQLLVP